jgi:hypothetical protein
MNKEYKIHKILNKLNGISKKQVEEILVLLVLEQSSVSGEKI